jgi:hypothetical protein
MQDWARFEMERKSFLPAWLGRTQYGNLFRGRTLLMQVAANGNTTRQR